MARAANGAKDSDVSWKWTGSKNLGGIRPQSVPKWTHLGDAKLIQSTPYFGWTKRPLFKDGGGLLLRRALQDVYKARQMQKVEWDKTSGGLQEAVTEPNPCHHHLILKTIESPASS